jgi:hypothetical protein
MKRAQRTHTTAGITLVELLIGLALAGLLTSFLFSVVRAQLIAHELNDQLGRTQMGARNGADFIEAWLRRACSGATLDSVAVNLPGRSQEVLSCLRVTDGAVTSGGSFGAGAADALPDAVEIIAGGTPMTVAMAAPALGERPEVLVADVGGFAVGDLVLLSDYQRAALFRISNIVPSVSPGGTLQLGGLSGPVLSPDGLTLGVGSAVLRASAASFYIDGSDPAMPVLMLDPDGPLGADHQDAQPLLDGALDLQLAVALDRDGDGAFPESSAGADEWWGNQAGELPLPLPPWNRTESADPQPRLIRATLLVRTASDYPGSAPTPGAVEDRAIYPTWPSAAPRLRALRVVVAPRAWNTRE